MGKPDVLVIDDQRTFRFPAVYARTAAEGMSRLAEREWREVWLDYNLGTGLTIDPVLRLLEERATRGRPIPIGVICVHTSGPAEGDAMIAALTPWYRVRRVVAHSFRAS
jgi:Cyclic-phosphate processing Receiver domain